MAENNKREVIKPGVCFPWEEKETDPKAILGDVEMIKNEWEKLDTMAYMYLWYWVQR